ncbi:hypothetical protein [Natrinema gelatinilyticum]|uniref:hypothetical protein n=1 Tax=Natrinema gelatinilyticum TaxID=2961571 RepID=UPI0020C41FC2|nr:hypothetical protein [Natrinema gelatinilyticum]
MSKLTPSERSRTVSRRSVLTAATVAGLGTLAGCVTGTPENGTGTDDVDGGSDISESDRELAAEMVETIDADLTVIGWELPGMFIPEYTDSIGLEEDVAILGSAYADIADRGFDHKAMPTAQNADGEVEFMVFIEPEWANSFLDDDWSETEYYTRIEESVH